MKEIGWAIFTQIKRHLCTILSPIVMRVCIRYGYNFTYYLQFVFYYYILTVWLEHITDSSVYSVHNGACLTILLSLAHPSAQFIAKASLM